MDAAIFGISPDQIEEVCRLHQKSDPNSPLLVGEVPFVAEMHGVWKEGWSKTSTAARGGPPSSSTWMADARVLERVNPETCVAEHLWEGMRHR